MCALWESKKDKNSFQRNSVLLTRHHARPVVNLCFNPIHVTYVTPHNTAITRYVITYGTWYHASGHMMMYRECYGFERAVFTLRRFLPCTPSCYLKASLGLVVQSQISRASCWSSKHSPGLTICSIYSTPQKSFT